jgi:hypothetical protein
MMASRVFKFFLASTTIVWVGCTLFDDSTAKKASNSGLIATPVTYYSTSRARYLGAKYKENLDRIVERIVRNPKTANLQFANNIASVGGIGFFTHSATKTADERYLEVVLAAPETFETKGGHNDKLNRLFALYGTDLLGTLSSDNDIYQDKELTGYALNLSWRNVMADSAASRVALERAIVYLSKEKSRKYLHREINQNELLAEATIFAVEEDGPLNLISYRAPELPQEYPATIREDDISPAQVAVKPEKSPSLVKTEPLDQGKKEAIPVKEPMGKNAPLKPPVAVAQKTKPLPPKAPAIPDMPRTPTPQTPVLAPAETLTDAAIPVELAKLEVSAPSVSFVSETQHVTPVNAQIAKNTEPARTGLNTPKPLVTSNTVRPLPVEVALPAEVSAPAKSDAPPAILAPRNEGSAPAQLAESPKIPNVDFTPFLAAPASGAMHTPEPESPMDHKPLPSAPIAKAQVNDVDITTPVLPGVKSAPLAIETKVRSTVTAPPASVAIVEAPLIDRAGPPAMVVKSATEQLPGDRPVLAPAQPMVSGKPPVRSVAPAPAAAIESAPARPAVEQLASLVNKPQPSEAATTRSLVVRPGNPKPLEGFIIQLAFNDKERAQRWAEGMEKKGFAISVTEAGAEGALRVRLGNFVLRDDAERQLKAIKQEGLSGIILNLPQAFRPEARTSIP